MLVFCGPKVVFVLDTDGSLFMLCDLVDPELLPDVVGWNWELLPACPKFELD